MTEAFIVQVRVKNGALLRAIRERYGTAAEMARVTGISPSRISAMLAMREAPIMADKSDWRKSAYDVSSALGVAPEILWPGKLAVLKLARNEAEFSMSEGAVTDMIENRTVSKIMLERWMNRLPDRERQTINLIAEGMTHDEVGMQIGGVTRERVRQIEAKALRRIQDYARTDGVRKLSDLSA